MAKEITFIAVRRNEDETVTLVFKCRVSSQQIDELTVVSSIKTALTNWVNNTEEGKKAWNYSANDFNFADLAAQNISGDLQVFMEKAGVFEIDVQQIVDLNEFNLDTVLIDSKDITE